MSTQMKWVIAIVAIIVALGVIYWSLQTGSQSEQVNTRPTTPVITLSPTLSETVKTFDIEGKPFEFSLKEIRVKEGERVRVNFTNTQGFHDWGIDEFRVRTKQLQAGQSETVEFIASKKGEFEYYCSVGTHRQMGVVGKLIVE